MSKKRKYVPAESVLAVEASDLRAATSVPPGVSERRIVERLPDGRTRTTVIRQVSRSQRPSRSMVQEPVFRGRLANDHDDD